jgi:hypothetical protein
MYSGTDESNAKKIVASGAHEGIYLTTDPDFAMNYGDFIVIFLVPKDIKVSLSKEFDFTFDAELDTWGNHAIIVHNPEAVKVLGMGSADEVVGEHYF